MVSGHFWRISRGLPLDTNIRHQNRIAPSVWARPSANDTENSGDVSPAFQLVVTQREPRADRRHNYAPDCLEYSARVPLLQIEVSYLKTSLTPPQHSRVQPHPHSGFRSRWEIHSESAPWFRNDYSRPMECRPFWLGWPGLSQCPQRR
jgi:hypothetical protein